MSPPGFKARVGSLIHTWRCTCYTFPKIHLWCDTCCPLGALNHDLLHWCSQYETSQTLYRLSYAGSVRGTRCLCVNTYPFLRLDDRVWRQVLGVVRRLHVGDVVAGLEGAAGVRNHSVQLISTNKTVQILNLRLVSNFDYYHLQTKFGAR